MRAASSLVLLVVLVLTVSCSGRTFTSADATAVRAVLERQRDAWNRGDLDAFMEGYHQRPEIVFTSSAKIRRGYDEAMQAYQRRYVDGDAAMGTLAFTEIEITGLGPDAALAMGRFELTDTPQAGWGIFSLVLTREDDRWGIMHDHSSGADTPSSSDSTATAEDAPEPPRRRVAITIDDLPVAAYGSYPSDEERRAVVEGLCRVLTEARVPATGFVNMVNHERDPSLMQAWKSCGIELGNHTWSHPKLEEVGLDTYLEDLDKGHAALRELLGDDRPIPFRYPYLHRGFDPEEREAIAERLRALDSQVAPVTIDAWDWRYSAGFRRAKAAGDDEAAERWRTSWMWDMQEATLEAEHLGRALFDREPPQILLIHANAMQANDLPAYLSWLRRRGYAFVPLGEALADEAYAEADASWSPSGDSWWLRLRRSRSLAHGASPFHDLDPAPEG